MATVVQGGETLGEAIGKGLGGLIAHRMTESTRKREREHEHELKLKQLQMVQQYEQQAALQKQQQAQAEQAQLFAELQKYKYGDQEQPVQNDETRIPNAPVATSLNQALAPSLAQGDIAQRSNAMGNQIRNMFNPPQAAQAEQQNIVPRANQPQAPQQAQAQAPNQRQTKPNQPRTVPEDFVTKLALRPATAPAARIIQSQNEAAVKQQNRLEDIARENEQASRKEKLEFHKESKDIDDEIRLSEVRAKKQEIASRDIRKALKSGNVSPSNLSNIFKDTGPWGQKIAESLINKDQAAFQASQPMLLEGWKDVFGVRITDADLRILQDKLPGLGKSVEANQAILNILDKYTDVSKMRGQIARQIKEENGGLRPLGYGDLIESRLEQEMEKKYPDMDKEVMVIHPKTGQPVPVKRKDLDRAISGGGKLVNE